MDIDALTAHLETLADPGDVAFVQRYMGTPRCVLGVKTPALRALAKRLAHDLADDVARLDALNCLYAGPCFEHRALAGHLLHALPEWRKTIELVQLRSWIGNLDGWCEIDTTCQSGWTAAEYLARWGDWQPFLTSLPQSPKLSLRRAALVLPLAPLRESADKCLSAVAFVNLDALAAAREPLITKAQSWLLRGLIKHHATDVMVWLEANKTRLATSVARETATKLETGRKTPPGPGIMTH